MNVTRRDFVKWAGAGIVLTEHRQRLHEWCSATGDAFDVPPGA